MLIRSPDVSEPCHVKVTYTKQPVPPFLFQLDPAPQKILVLICRSPYFWKEKKPPKLVGFERDDDV